MNLRHYALSALIAEGADIELLQAVAGHHDDPRGLRHLMTERVAGATKLYVPLQGGFDGLVTSQWHPEHETGGLLVAFLVQSARIQATVRV